MIQKETCFKNWKDLCVTIKLKCVWNNLTKYRKTASKEKHYKYILFVNNIVVYTA
jgi:hypothetical protein